MTGKFSHIFRRISTLPLAQREVALLLMLSMAAAMLFVTTRTLAGWSRSTHAREAAVWFSRGEAALAQGRPADAVAPLRRAVQADRQNRAYAVMLARALIASDRTDEAWQILLRLRETSVDDPEINHRLAQLAVRRGDIDAAVKYFHNAMYGIAGPASEPTRHAIAIELARVLLDHGLTDKALAELIALATDLDPSSVQQLPVARMFLQAGDPARALRLFLNASRGPAAADAHAGAGDAALAMHDLARAEREWLAAARAGANVATRLDFVRAVRDHDPLARGLNARERGRRLTVALASAAERLLACPGPDAVSLRTEIDTFRRAHPTMSMSRDDDALVEGVALVGRTWGLVGRTCAIAGDADTQRLWTEIDAQHHGGRP